MSLIVVVVQSLNSVWLFATPWITACRATLSFTISWSLLKLIFIESVMPPNYFILCMSFSSWLQSFPGSWSFPVSRLLASGQGIGASASTLVFPMNIQDWFPLGLTGLISFQGTLKSLPQDCSSKASVLRCSAFFMVQVSHLYSNASNYWKNHGFD